jgi:hypothetical protein
MKTNKKNYENGGWFIGLDGFKIENSQRTTPIEGNIYYPFNEFPKINRGRKFDIIIQAFRGCAQSRNSEIEIIVNGKIYRQKDGKIYLVTRNSRRSTEKELLY